MPNPLQDRVYAVVADVLGVPVDALNGESSPDTSSEWDSLSHLNLVVALEEAFGITFTDDDVAEMLSVSLIETILVDRGVTVASPNDVTS